LKLDPTTEAITDKALISILLRYQKNDEVLEAVKLIKLLFISDPSPEIAVEILNIIGPKEVFNNVGAIPSA